MRDAAGQLAVCLDAIGAQRYEGSIEVLVIDGGSRDGTRALARGRPGVRVLDNARGSRPAGMNVGLRAASGEIVVRVDARTVIEPDYVLSCVMVLERTRAAIVGGPMRLVASTPAERGIAEAMGSRLGGGTARFRRRDPRPGPTDTVYLGAYRRDLVMTLGGYDEDFGGNEDAELAFRAGQAGGVWLDPAIRSSYVTRASLGELFSQYRRYGTSRAGTMRKHPASLSPRQLAVPALVVGLMSPWRSRVLMAYLLMLGTRTLWLAASDPVAAPSFAAAIPVMHAGWAFGLWQGLVRRQAAP